MLEDTTTYKTVLNVNKDLAAVEGGYHGNISLNRAQRDAPHFVDRCNKATRFFKHFQFVVQQLGQLYCACAKMPVFVIMMLRTLFQYFVFAVIMIYLQI